MKRIGGLLVAVAMVVGLAGCDSGGGSDPDPVGTWTMTTDWQCDGSPTASVLHIFNDGTWENAEEHSSGGWTLNGDSFMMLDAKGTIYSGELNEVTISGTIQGPVPASGIRATGCWSATRFSETS